MNRYTRKFSIAQFFICFIIAGISFLSLPAYAEQSSLRLPGDAKAGWQTFFSKNCINCHSIWGKGGHVGPDLGRAKMAPFSAARLATTMWNHIPQMHAKMEEYHIPFTKLTLAEMSNLYAFLYFIQYLDEPGNVLAGREILVSKGCGQCHRVSDTDKGGGIGLDVTKWSPFINPIIMADKMWSHAPAMKALMRRKGIKWPELTGVDLVNIIAYVQSLGTGGEDEYLMPGSPIKGEELFTKKNCIQCHEAGLAPQTPKIEIAKDAFPQTLAEMAMKMWSHFPVMLQAMQSREIEQPRLTAQEMADLIAYLFAVRSTDPEGDPALGAEVFMQNRCPSCHVSGEDVNTKAPSLKQMKRNVTPIAMATQLWRSSGVMQEQMAENGIPWPTLTEKEMVDLISFFRHKQSNTKK